MATYFRNDGWVKSAQGPAVPGAQIFVCTQPASAPPALSALVPTPSPLASVFADVNGLVPITQPIITDGFGHYNFYALPGSYTLLVYNSGRLQQTYPDQSLGGIGSGGGTAVVLETNEVNNGSQTLLDLHAGSNITLTDDGAGRVTIAATGGGSMGPRPSLGNWHYWNGMNLGTQFTVGTGMSLQQTGPVGTGFAHSSVAATDTEPTYSKFSTNAVAAAMGWLDNTNATSTNNSAGITLGLLTDWQSRVLTPTTTSVRYWIGMSDGLIAQGGGNYAYLQSDAPTSNPMLAFRYSTNAGDTHWQCVAQVDSSHQTIVDSGIALDSTASHTFEIKMIAGAAVFLIDSFQVASITTNLPASNRLLSQCVFQDNLGASVALNFGIAYLYWESSK